MRLPFIAKKKNAKGLIGVDIQANRLAIAHIINGDKPEDSPVLKQCAFADIAADQNPNSVLAKLAQSFPIKQFFCNTSIASEQYELFLIDAPNVESGELRQAVRWRIKEQLNYHIDDAIIDVFEIPGQQSHRAKLMYVVSAQRQDLDNIQKILSQAGLEIQSIDIYELTQRNIAAILPDDQDGMVILRLNQQDGLLTVTRNKTLYLTRKIDFGYERLLNILNMTDAGDSAGTKNLDEDIDLSMDEVEDFDDAQTSLADETSINNAAELSDAAKAVIDQVILEIQRSLDYYVSHFNQRPVGKIMLAPIGQEIPSVLNYISDMLGIKTEVLDFNQYLQVARPLDQALQSRCFDAIGLALRQDLEQG
jgi:MSHA biogenesis protein MshI